MQLARPMFALDPRRFGRRPAPQPRFSISADLKLFATTFIAGFLFVLILIA